MTVATINLDYGRFNNNLILTGESVINISIYNILTTSVGSILFNRDFGTDSFIAGKLDLINTSRTALDVYKSLKEYEPRITITPSDVIATIDEISRVLTIRINYIINETQETGTFEGAGDLQSISS